MTRKQHPWDESIRVPFLLRCPDQAGHGRHLSFPFSVVDVLPTLLGLAGVPIPESVEGADVSRAVRNEPFPAPELALIMCITPFAEYVGAPWRGVRSARYSYARWLDGKGILYDILGDPDQLDNRYGSRSSAALQRRLEDAMQQLLAERGDRFLPAAHYIEQYGFTVDERGAVPFSY